MADIKIYGTLLNETESDVIAYARQVYYKTEAKDNGDGSTTDVTIDVKTAIDNLENKISEIGGDVEEDVYKDDDFLFNGNALKPSEENKEEENG